MRAIRARAARAVAAVILVAHRWLGAVLSLFLTVWFVSGIVMMYRGYPAVTLRDRLERTPVLDPARIRLSAADAFAAAGAPAPPSVLLTSIDGRPVYLGGGYAVYADDGREQGRADDAMMDRVAAAWAGQPATGAVTQVVTVADQWTLGGGLRGLLPLRKYSWPDGQQVYVHPDTGEVAQYTTTATRFWAYLGAIPHWLYIPALRTRDGTWHALMVWSSLGAVVVAILGLAIAGWMCSPRRRYRHDGAPSRIPYRGWKRWHTIAGLACGVTTVTWAFSGLLSLEPFQLDDRLSEILVPSRTEDDAALEAWRRMLTVLRAGSLELSSYASTSPGDAIRSVPGFGVKEVEYAALAGRAIYVLTDGSGGTRIVPVGGDPIDGLDGASLIGRLRAVTGKYPAQFDLLDQYDLYYRNRHGRLPLPVVRVRMTDSLRSRHYIDPRTFTIMESYSDGSFVQRWLFQGLHSLDLPWLYNHRPLWDIVMLTLLLGGTGLCVTSVRLAVRLLARTIGPAAWRRFGAVAGDGPAVRHVTRSPPAPADRTAVTQ